MLEEKLASDFVQAMKERNTIKSSTLSFLRAQLKNVIIDKKVEKLPDEDVIAVIKKQIKQRQDSISQFEQGGRKDLVEKETAEVDILKQYLPEELSEDTLKVLVNEAIKEAQASGIKDMGKVMKVMLPKIAGKADNKLVSDLVKELLSKM